MAKFTRVQLIKSISESTDSTIETTEAFFNAFKLITTEQVKSGNDVALGSDFGTFKSKVQKPKSGKIPGTNKPYQTLSKRVIKFESSAPMKKVIAN